MGAYAQSKKTAFNIKNSRFYMIYECVIDLKQCDNLESNSVSDVLQLWIYRYFEINKYLINKYKNINLVHDAEGLFTLFLIYALNFFHTSINTELFKTSCEHLSYGLKEFLHILSRISFHELYANLGEDNKIIFKKS